MKRSLLATIAGLTIIFLIAAVSIRLGVASEGGAAPPTLKWTDIKSGTGKRAVKGSLITVHYTGWLYSPGAPMQHGAKFDTTEGIAPFTFPLGRGKVISGLDKGLEGMMVGGKRTLIVPSALAYGQKGLGPVPPNANLIFDVELIDVK